MVWRKSPYSPAGELKEEVELGEEQERSHDGRND
jgi:hypothetical protein